MTTYIAQQSLVGTHPPEISHSISCDVRKTPMLFRKRLLSDQSDRYAFPTEISNDETGLFKKSKTGNCVILLSTQGAESTFVFDCILLHSPTFVLLHMTLQERLLNTFFFFSTNRLIEP